MRTTMDTTVWTVSQLTHAIKSQLESKFRFVCIQGEISNFKQQASGHIYFSLKDSDAQISSVMFRGNASKLTKPPKAGDQIIVKGELSVYPPHGKYQLIVKELTYVGLGELLQKLEVLKREVHRRGWFSQEHKKPLPKLPKKIGVITSPTGAVIQDILNVLKRRFSGFHLLLNPVRVQGTEAAGEVVQAIEQFNKHNLVDVIIMGRGGGSIEDLWAFNEECVAHAIFHSKIPIIAAIGHETDHTIADYVADVRAPTPSAAAEIVIAEKAQQEKALELFHRRLGQTVFHLIKQNRHRLEGIIRHPLFTSPYTLLGNQIQKMDDMRLSLNQSIRQQLLRMRLAIEAKGKQTEALKPTAQIRHFRQKLIQTDRSLQNLMAQFIALRKERMGHLIQGLQVIDPKNLLSKGYSILFSEKDNSVIVSTHQMAPNDTISVMVSDGKAKATVKEVYNNEQ